MDRNTTHTDQDAQSDDRPVFTREQQEKLLDEVMSLSRTKGIRREEHVEAMIDIETGDIVWRGKLQRGSYAMPPDSTGKTVGAGADSCWVSREMVAREMMRRARQREDIIVETGG